MADSASCTFDGKLLRALRKHLKLSLTDLADFSGVCVSTLYQLETGRKQAPTLTTISALADTLNVTPTLLLQPFDSTRNNDLLVSYLRGKK